MKRIFLIFNGLLALALFSSAHAQVHPCGGPGPGEVVVGQTDASNGVAAVPLCRSVDDPSDTATQAPSLHWETRWGATATDASSGALGSVTGMQSQKAAEKGALADCKAKGGINCVLQLPYKNGCTAMIVGDSKFLVTADRTIATASQQGIEACSKVSSNCQVYFTACSPPAVVH